ncbi:putative serine incorporator [Trypoxylus dichotomus]
MPDSCDLNKYFISFNLILFSLYLTFLTWSTVSNQSDKSCNPGLLGIVGGGEKTHQVGFDVESIIGLIIWLLCVMYSSFRSASNSSKLTMTEHVLVKDDGAVRNDQDGLVSSEGGESNDGGESGGHKVWDNEDESVAYSWTFFHVMFALATLTNWYKPNSSLQTFNADSASMWIKRFQAGCAWVSMVGRW